MATYTADLKTGVQPIPYPNHANEVLVVRATFSLTAALALNDVIQFCDLPKGSVPVASATTLVTDELDTNGSPTLQLDVGTSDDPNALIDSSTHGDTLNTQGPNVKTAYNWSVNKTEDTTIQAVVTDAPATGATSGDVILELAYRDAS